jgi:hypothetical protein
MDARVDPQVDGRKGGLEQGDGGALDRGRRPGESENASIVRAVRVHVQQPGAGRDDRRLARRQHLAPASFADVGHALDERHLAETAWYGTSIACVAPPARTGSCTRRATSL